MTYADINLVSDNVIMELANAICPECILAITLKITTQWRGNLIGSSTW